MDKQDIHKRLLVHISDEEVWILNQLKTHFLNVLRESDLARAGLNQYIKQLENQYDATFEVDQGIFLPNELQDEAKNIKKT